MRGLLRFYPILWIAITSNFGAVGWVARYPSTKKYGLLLQDRKSVIRFDSEKEALWAPTPSTSNSLVQSATPIQPKQSLNNKNQTKSFWVSPDGLNQIKEQVDMISMLESYGLDQFRRTGPNRATALCPFHDDRNPSFNVDADRGLYKCFSCGAGGDVFKFVREYHKITQKEEMPFMEAVRRVNAYLSGHDTLGSNPSQSIQSPIPMITSDEHKALTEKRERIYAMNLEAAAFYSKCLTLPYAGGARYYLQSRGFKSPAITRQFAVGYAPDVYYNNRFLPKEQKSLVRHLEERGFNASEILKSGLCVQTRNQKENNQINNSTGNDKMSPDANNQTDTVDVDISSLMDRFRGRLVVPIFDRTGKKVLGFGGRILPVYNEDEAVKPSKFNPPKYLNSPETTVFHKSQVLFGEHIVREELDKKSIKNKGASPDRRSQSTINSDIIVVEGYMDVLTLSYVGVKTAVATMGTAISLDQVNAAAKLAASCGGRVVFCLDNDEAGYAAIERLCGGDFLRKASASYSVQICIATLIPGVKDPGDYIEGRLEQAEKTVDIAQNFWTEIAKPAVDWSDWYLDRIMDQYDDTAIKGKLGSVGDIFNRVSEFLSRFSNPADRTKSAYDVATKLAKLMAKEGGSKDASQAARLQLESDLIESASKLAKEREAQTKRAEIADDSVGLGPVQALILPSDRKVSHDQIEKLSTAALKKLNSEYIPTEDTGIGEPMMNAGEKKIHRQSFEGAGRPRRRMYRPLTEKEEPALTPHFAGFHFENPADADWLNIPRNKAQAANSILTLGEMNSFEEPGLGVKRFKPKPVYFNSNDYHGNHFISIDAINAGYSDKTEMTDMASIKEKGVSTLVAQGDVEGNLRAAEFGLLRSLVLHYPDSVIAVKDVLEASAQVGPDVPLDWSSPEREWLFSCLMDKDMLERSSASSWDIADLRANLVARSDLPSGAFGENWRKNETGSYHTDDDATIHARSENSLPLESTSGTLDSFFVEDVDSPESISNDHSDEMAARAEKAMLRSQEQLMNLLSAGASRQVMIIQEELSSFSELLQAQTQTPNTLDSVGNDGGYELSPADLSEAKTTGTSKANGVALTVSTRHSNIEKFNDMSPSEIQLHQQDLISRYQRAVERRLHLDRSAKRITERLMRFSSTTLNEAVEGRISISLQKKLAKDVEAVLTEIEKRGTNADGFHDDRLGIRGDESILEDELAEMERNWGDWCEDDFVWSPEKASRNCQSSALTLDLDDLDDDQENESLEETLARIDDEWKNWIE